MNLEDQVVSLELAKHLKELGFEKESIFVWQFNDGHYRIEYEEESIPRKENLPAFTVAELGEMLPYYIKDNYHLTSVKLDINLWGTDYRDWSNNCSFSFSDTEDKSEADARAKMLIYLIENKLIEV